MAARPRPDVDVGDVVRMRKPHPCGGDQWEVLRIGMDFRLRCLRCGRLVMLPRPHFEKGVKEIVSRRTDGQQAPAGREGAS